MWEHQGKSAQVDASTFHPHWELSRFLAGGRYRLCWCAAGFSCGVEDFRVDIGSLDMLGPAPLYQHRTCTTGQLCSFETLLGYHVEASDLTAVLSTCGDASVPIRLPSSGRLQTTLAGQDSWDGPVISASGGRYCLCWCAASSFSCSRLENYVLDAGELFLIGPSALEQHRTCVTGQGCALHDIAIIEFLPFDTSSIMILDTCGVAHWPQESTPSGRLAVVSASGTQMNWDANLVMPAGQYRMCWCSSPGHSCSVMESFKVDMGELMMLGPGPLEQSATCISGHVCSLTMSGLGLSVRDQVIVLATCSNSDPVPGFLDGGLSSRIQSGGSNTRGDAGTWAYVNWGQPQSGVRISPALKTSSIE